MPNLADRNAARFTPEVVASLLAGYGEAARGAILSEAEIWRHGDVESARVSYDRVAEWARKLTRGQRKYHVWGAWYANQGLTYSALREVMREAGHDGDMHDESVEARA